MMEVQWRLLGEVLVNIDDEPLSGEILTKEEYPWDADSLCVVLDPPEEDYYTDGSTDFTRQNGLKPILMIERAWGVVSYALEQQPHATARQLADCINYYYKYGGLLDLSGTV